MTTSRTFAEHEGELGEPTPTGEKCPRCGSETMHQLWTSNCGSYEDSKYTCSNPDCEYVRWIDGIDA